MNAKSSIFTHVYATPENPALGVHSVNQNSTLHWKKKKKKKSSISPVNIYTLRWTCLDQLASYIDESQLILDWST